MLKLAVAGVLALAFPPPSPPPIDFGPNTFVTHRYVKQVKCERIVGSAFKIDTGQWLSVNHVSANGGCRVDGMPIHVVHADPIGDFSIIDFGDRSPGGIPVDCGGFRDGEWYYGIGFGWGIPVPQSKAVRHSLVASLFERRWNVLKGNRFVPGMSGGVVIDQAGKALGTINAYGETERIALSRSLQDTKICP